MNIEARYTDVNHDHLPTAIGTLDFSDDRSPISFKRIIGHSLMMSSNCSVARIIRKRFEGRDFRDLVTQDDVFELQLIKAATTDSASKIYPNDKFLNSLDSMVVGNPVTHYYLGIFESFFKCEKGDFFTRIYAKDHEKKFTNLNALLEQTMKQVPRSFQRSLSRYTFWLNGALTDETGAPLEIEVQPFFPLQGHITDWPNDRGIRVGSGQTAFGTFYRTIFGRNIDAIRLADGSACLPESLLHITTSPERQNDNIGIEGYVHHETRLFFAEIGESARWIDGLRRGHALDPRSSHIDEILLTGEYEAKNRGSKTSYGAEARADNVNVDDYQWAGPIWFGLICGLRISNHFGNRVKYRIEEILQGDSAVAEETISESPNGYVIMPSPDIAFAPALNYYKKLGAWDSKSPVRVSRNIMTPRKVKDEFNNWCKPFSFPSARKKNKGGVQRLTSHSPSWDEPVRRPIGVRGSQQAAMNPLAVAGQQVGVLTSQTYNATNMTRSAVADNKFYETFYRGWRQDNKGVAWKLDYLPKQEWCHLVGHGDGGSETEGNLVSGSHYANTLQLAIEMAIRTFPELHRNLHLFITTYLIPSSYKYLENSVAIQRVVDLSLCSNDLAEARIDIVKDWLGPLDNSKSTQIDVYYQGFLSLIQTRDSVPNDSTFSNVFEAVVGDFDVFGIQGGCLKRLCEEFDKYVFNSEVEKANGWAAIRRVAMNCFHRFIEAICFQHPAAAFIRYAVRIKRGVGAGGDCGGKVFDFIYDGQIETFDKNEFRILKERIVLAVIHAFHLARPTEGVDKKYIEYLEGKILRVVQGFQNAYSLDECDMFFEFLDIAEELMDVGFATDFLISKSLTEKGNGLVVGDVSLRPLAAFNVDDSKLFRSLSSFRREPTPSDSYPSLLYAAKREATTAWPEAGTPDDFN
ncbi:hypothetical protein [Paraburkholderia phytofirmans]|uniref:hypothetical protein n=1 Tax=Paraburkholderia phytofirmans TaxID=261302 RepID=UPI0038B6D16A